MGTRLRRLRTGAAITVLLLLTSALLACGDDAPTPDASADAAAATATPPPSDSSTLEEVRSRGVLRVGVNDALPGFGYVRGDGTFGGFDVDFGHALAAAIFGDRNAVQFVAVSAGSRFEALRVHEIDILIRNTTGTLTRDVPQEVAFAVTTY